MKGIKKVAGMTQRYCEKDGYGMEQLVVGGDL